VVILAWAAWTHRNEFVDGYIYLHIVQNILAGNGPVYNSGQRVEAFTSPAWTFLLAAVGFATRASLVWISVIMGILLTLAGLAIAIVYSGQLVQRAIPRAFLVPLGAIIFVALPPVWSLASSGLETGLEFFWLAICFMLLVRWSRSMDRSLGPWAFIVLGLGPLIRPELLLDSIVFIAVLMFVDRPGVVWKDRIRTAAWAAFVPLAYEVFRMGYYGMLVANTATAKEASLPRVGRGIEYFSDFVGPYWLFVPALLVLLGAYYPIASAFRQSKGQERNLAALLALPTAAFLNAVYIVIMGGDYVHARLFLAPFFAACVPIASVPMVRKTFVALLVIPWAALCMATFRTADGGHWTSQNFYYLDGHGTFTPRHVVRGPSGTAAAWTPASGIYVQFSGPETITKLKATPAPDLHTPVVATSWIGHEPYTWGTGVQILDLFGLADPLTAHLLLVNRGSVAGHEKPLPTPWIAALLTAPGSSTAQLGKLQNQRPLAYTPIAPPVHGYELTVQTAWARAALTCPAIHNLEFGPSAPLTVGTFISNMFHAASRTELRIPAEPEAAYHEFCGPGTPEGVRSAETS
jgi:arabinofuranosyltransferase